MFWRNIFVITVIILSLSHEPNLGAQETSPAAAPASGTISKTDCERALGILDAISKAIRELYYDPKMNGVDWNAVVASARTRIAQSHSMNDALMQIAVAVSALNDSHTAFVPPARPYRLDFGFEYELIWNRCFVMRVRPGSDAEAQGLKPSTEILSINGIVPNRQNFSNIEYLTYSLDPQPEMHLQVRYRASEKRDLKIKAKLTMSPDTAYRLGSGVTYDVWRTSEAVIHRMRPQLAQFGDVGILKLPWFFYPPPRFYSQPDADKFYDIPSKIRKDKAVIIDLRGNHGGSDDTMKSFIGMFFDHNVKLGDTVQRRKTSPEIAKGEGHSAFSGRMIVLVDSECASAAEIFARVVQLEKRGIVIGDHTSGRVMESTYFHYASSGVDYGAAVTVANLVMTDGKSLEHIGVNPDEIMFSKLADIESGNDPVLSHAAQELGVTLSPEDAGKLFRYEWPAD